MQQTLSTGYPRLLRLFHDFFGKIAVHTDTVYSDTFQRSDSCDDGLRLTADCGYLEHSPETILLLRSLSGIEAQYLARSSNKITEAVGQTYSGGARAPSGSSEGINVARIVVNEMDAARFDPLLVKAVAKNTATCLDNILNRLESSVSRMSYCPFLGNSHFFSVGFEGEVVNQSDWTHGNATTDCQRKFGQLL